MKYSRTFGNLRLKLQRPRPLQCGQEEILVLGGGRVVQASKLSPWGCLGSILSNTSFVTSHTLTIMPSSPLMSTLGTLQPAYWNYHHLSPIICIKWNVCTVLLHFFSENIILQKNILVQMTICKVLLEKEIRLWFNVQFLIFKFIEF